MRFLWKFPFVVCCDARFMKRGCFGGDDYDSFITVHYITFCFRRWNQSVLGVVYSRVWWSAVDKTFELNMELAGYSVPSVRKVVRSSMRVESRNLRGSNSTK